MKVYGAALPESKRPIGRGVRLVLKLFGGERLKFFLLGREGDLIFRLTPGCGWDWLRGSQCSEAYNLVSCVMPTVNPYA